MVLKDMGAVAEFWGRCEAEAPEGRRRAEAHEYFKLTRASHIIFQCGVEFGAQPSAEYVREARRAILDGAKSKLKFAAELGKAFVGYKGAQIVMGNAKTFAAASAADEAASATLNSAVATFEEAFPTFRRYRRMDAWRRWYVAFEPRGSGHSNAVCPQTHHVCAEQRVTV